MSSIDRIRGYIEVIRLTPYDTSTEYGRSKERYRLIALSGFTSLFAKLITSLLNKAKVPLIAPLPVPYTGDWTEFVNTPMTPAEIEKSRKLIIRQKNKSG